MCHVITPSVSDVWILLRIPSERERQRRENISGSCFGWEESLDGCFRIISDKHLISFFRIYWLTTYREKFEFGNVKNAIKRENRLEKMKWGEEDSHEWNKGFGFLMGYCPMGFRFGHGGITVRWDVRLVLKTPTHYSFFLFLSSSSSSILSQREKKGKQRDFNPWRVLISISMIYHEQKSKEVVLALLK